MKVTEKRRRKGFSLVELCIVIAVLAVVTVLTTTFIILMSNRTKLATQKNDVLTDLYNTELAMQRWIRHYDNADYVFKVGGGQKTLTAVGQAGSRDANKTFSIGLAEDGKTIKCDGMSDWTVRYIRSFEFKFQVSTESKSSGRYIIECIVRYEDPTNEENPNCQTVMIFTTHAHAIVNL